MVRFCFIKVRHVDYFLNPEIVDVEINWNSMVSFVRPILRLDSVSLHYSLLADLL